jgi:hypothetical protein
MATHERSSARRKTRAPVLLEAMLAGAASYRLVWLTLDM